MQEQIQKGFPDFRAGLETGFTLLTLFNPVTAEATASRFSLKLDLQLFAKKDIEMIVKTAKKWKMTPEQRREFGDFIEHLKGKSGKRGDDNFTWKELQEIAKEFLE